MKWISHKILSFSVVLSVSGNLVGAGVAIVGSIFPDVIEGRGVFAPHNSMKYKKWKVKHRGLSHLFALYLVGFCVSFLLLHTHKEIPLYMFLFVATYFFAGCCLHIIEDSLCGKVPFFLPQKKYGLMLFKVGSAVEYVFTISVSAILLWQLLV